MSITEQALSTLELVVPALRHDHALVAKVHAAIAALRAQPAPDEQAAGQDVLSLAFRAGIAPTLDVDGHTAILGATEESLVRFAVLYAASPAHPQPAPQAEAVVKGMPFSEAKKVILDLPADDARGLAISLLIQNGILEKYATPQQAAGQAAIQALPTFRPVRLEFGVTMHRDVSPNESGWLRREDVLAAHLAPQGEVTTEPSSAATVKGICDKYVALDLKAGTATFRGGYRGGYIEMMMELARAFTKAKEFAAGQAVGMVPLSEEQIDAIGLEFSDYDDPQHFRVMARAIEAAHGIRPAGSEGGDRG